MTVLLQVLIITYALIDVKHLINVFINLLLHYFLDPNFFIKSGPTLEFR